MTSWLQEVRHIVTAVCPRFSRQAHDIFMLQPPAGCCMLPVACRQAVPQHDLLHYAALAVGTNPARFGKLKHPSDSATAMPRLLPCRRALPHLGLVPLRRPGSWRPGNCVHPVWRPHHQALLLWPLPGHHLQRPAPASKALCCAGLPHHCHSPRLPAQLWGLPRSAGCAGVALRLEPHHHVRISCCMHFAALLVGLSRLPSSVIQDELCTPLAGDPQAGGVCRLCTCAKCQRLLQRPVRARL